MAQLQLVSVLMSMAHLTTESHVDGQSLGHHLRSHWCLRVMLAPGPYQSEQPTQAPRAMVTSGPELQQKAIFGSVVLSQLGSVLMPVAHVTTKSHGRAGPGGLGTGELALPLASHRSRRAAPPLLGERFPEAWVQESWP